MGGSSRSRPGGGRARDSGFHSKSQPLLSLHCLTNTEPQEALTIGMVQTDRLGPHLPGAGGPRWGQTIRCEQRIRKSFSLAPFLASLGRQSSLPASLPLLPEGREDSEEPQTAPTSPKLSLFPSRRDCGNGAISKVAEAGVEPQTCHNGRRQGSTGQPHLHWSPQLGFPRGSFPRSISGSSGRPQGQQRYPPPAGRRQAGGQGPVKLLQNIPVHRMPE